MSEHRIFVYGTLLAGEPNHRILAEARRVRAAATEPNFTLLDLGAFPGLIAAGSTSIVGDVYAVDDRTLLALDRLEGHPRLYRRTPIELEDGERIESYVLPKSRAEHYPVIASGDW